MDQKMNILFFILIGFESVSLAITTRLHTSNYDITKTFQNSIHEILQNDIFNDGLRNFCKNKFSDCTRNSTFENATFYCFVDNDYYTSSSANMRHNFTTNEMRINFKTISKFGSGRLENLQEHKNYIIPMFSFSAIDVTLEISVAKKNNSDEKYPIDVSWQNVTFVNSNDDYFKLSGKYHGGQSNEETTCVKQIFKDIQMQKIRNAVAEYGVNFWNLLQNTTRLIFTSAHTDFFNNSQRYFYLIPNIPYICFNLRNITIRGLTNFALFKKTEDEEDQFGTTFLIKKIQGEMILDYGIDTEKPMELKFFADDLFIRANLRKNRNNVEFQNYQIVRSGLNVSLTDQQSKSIMQKIESGIATSSMPRMVACDTKGQPIRICSFTQFPLKNITNKMDFESKKKLLDEWVPFNEELTVKTDKTSTGQKDAYEYHVLFQNITIKLISANLNPKEIQCEFPNNFKITHDLIATPIRKLRLHGDKGDGIDLSFHANFSSINFSQFQSNSSSLKNTCEFQLENNENIKVELAQEKHADQSSSSQLKKKIDATLISIAKESFVQNIKPMVCLPFKICSQTAKIVDDFFLNFIDKVLKKCSLKGNKITNQ